MLFVVASFQSSEISSAACMFWIDCDQLPEIVSRLVQLVQLETDVTCMEERLRIIRLTLQKRLILGQRFIGHPAKPVNLRQVPESSRLTHRIVNAPGFPVTIESFIQLVGIEQRGGPVEVSVRVDTSQISTFLKNFGGLHP